MDWLQFKSMLEAILLIIALCILGIFFLILFFFYIKERMEILIMNLKARKKKKE